MEGMDIKFSPAVNKQDFSTELAAGTLKILLNNAAPGSRMIRSVDMRGHVREESIRLQAIYDSKM